MFYSENLEIINDIDHCFFSRKNGKSRGIYKSLNCGIGSKDDEVDVKNNLSLVSKKFNIEKNSLILMNQVHSNKVQIITKNNLTKHTCDAILTEDYNIALGVLTADCVPILIYETKKKIIGCIHAGWKGAIDGIIENTSKKLIEMGGNPKKLIVSVGPCISQKNYEVQANFYEKFIKKSKNNTSFFFKNEKNSFNFNLRGFVNKKLTDLNVSKIDNIEIDSFASESEYFSHRRAKKLGQDDYGRCISVIKKN